MLLLPILLAALSVHHATHATDEFDNFSKLVEDKYQKKMRSQVELISRASDPCRIQAIIGKEGMLPNTASRRLAQLRFLANKVQQNTLRNDVDPENAALRCREALLHNRKNLQLNLEICAEALAYFRRRNEEAYGRSSGASAWDDLIDNLKESMTVDDILEGLEFMDISVSLAFLIDNTGSMRDDIDEVSQITEQFVTSSQNIGNSVQNFVIMSFGDPDYQEPTAYEEQTHVVNHLENNIIASMGGDCPENTCQAIEELLAYSDLHGESPIYVFTDASSKDCNPDLVMDLGMLASGFDWRLNFVLTGSCDDEVDGNFTELAEWTSGSIYRLQHNEIHLLTGIVQDSVHSSAGELPYFNEFEYVDWDYGRKKRSVPGNAELHRHRRNVGYVQLSFYVDETLGKLTIQVTFESPADRRILEAVKLTPPARTTEGVECKEAEGEKFGNIVHYAMHCPCVGEWRISIPSTISNSWTFSANTFGEFTIGFDAMFEQQPPSRYNERSKRPCVGEQSVLWVSITQGDSIEGNDVTAYIMNSINHSPKLMKLVRSTTHKGYWTSKMKIPEDPFTIAIQGTTVQGNVFLRLLNTEIRPTKTCLKTFRISPSQNTIKAGGQTRIIMALKNKDTPKRYTIHCFNDRQREGFKTTITRPKYIEGMSRLETEVNRFYYIYIEVKAPPIAEVGEVVTVKCFAHSENSEYVDKTYEIMITSVYH